MSHRTPMATLFPMTPIARRLSRRWLPAVVLALTVLLPGAACAFDLDDVAAKAKALAEQPFQKPEGRQPKALQQIGYDRYRDIRYKADRAVWRKERLPFELQFFHQGLYYDRPVRISEIDGRAVRELKFSPDDFDYGDNKVDTESFRDLGFAGFRVHFPVNRPAYKDEVLVFLGASYLRALGKGQRYGLSARGLAIDTGLISGEEFPRFTDFWIVRPTASARELVIYALLNSRRATGAYRFVLKPGAETLIDTKARLYLRENVPKLGVAPLTSMFYFGENQPADHDDYRPEVHDSDGLSIASGTGEWIWRPLVNPKRLLVTSFSMSNPQGFGLMQRDRKFERYEDLEVRHELRPSLWIEPKGNWGAGRIELVQIPTPDETNDNVVAYWVPDKLPAPGSLLALDYVQRWQMESDTRPPLAWVEQTRRGRGGYARAADGSIGLVVDFVGPALSKLGPDARVEGVVSVDGNGELLERTTYRNEVTGGWRVNLRLKRVDDGRPVELRAYLKNDSSTLSETWSYVLPPG
jgi:glucans biosynthesis protein